MIEQAMKDDETIRDKVTRLTLDTATEIISLYSDTKDILDIAKEQQDHLLALRAIERREKQIVFFQAIH